MERDFWKDLGQSIGEGMALIASGKLTVYPGAVMALIRKQVTGIVLDGHSFHFKDWKSNGAQGVHQTVAVDSFDGKEYRVIVAPMDAQISIGGTPADEHFG